MFQGTSPDQFITPPERQEVKRSKFNTHVTVLIWKSYLQRIRRWRLLVAECVFAMLMFLFAVFIAKPVFLTPLEAEPAVPLSLQNIIKNISKDSIIGYAPKKEPYTTIMEIVANITEMEIISAENEDKLNEHLYRYASINRLSVIKKVSWVLWKPQVGNNVKFSIRSTEVGRLMKHQILKSATGDTQDKVRSDPHLDSGFLGLQCAISHALLEYTATDKSAVSYDLYLRAMPISPLMDAGMVSRAVSLILLCYTIALLPPVLETQGLVVTETTNRFKRALRIRNVDYNVMYLGWLFFAILSALPICLLGSISLILIFRWIHLFYALLMLLAYFTVMMMLAFMMAMFHSRSIIAGIWTVLQTMLQTFLAELIVHHRNFDDKIGVQTFIIKSLIPPLGLLNGLNQFALLRTGHASASVHSMEYTIVSWCILIFIYFSLLMLLQRTVGSAQVIGGQVSWQTIIFKQPKNKDELHPVRNPTLTETGVIQEVDDFIAKAVSFRDVSKKIMGRPLLSNVTFDIYRGEFTLVFSEHIQQDMIVCVEDLLTGLTYADTGSIHVLGVELGTGRNLLSERMMMGYCDRSSTLVDDLTVEEHLYLYTQICLWYESSEKTFEFSMIRHSILKKECDLQAVNRVRTMHLGKYYQAQLCWAIAILLEPRLVVMPDFTEDPKFMNVIVDKIMSYKSFISIVKLTMSSMELQYADRLFLLDNRVLAFGGTPEYMFFKYGRDYRVRVNFIRNHGDDDDALELIRKMKELGASVRVHLGSVLIMRIPTEPSAKVAMLCQEVERVKEQCGIARMYIALPDPEEVFRRAIHTSRSTSAYEFERVEERSKEAISRLREIPVIKCRKTYCSNLMHLRTIAWKFVSCYIHYRFYLIVTLISAIIAGYVLGKTFANMLQNIEDGEDLTFVDKLTVEAMDEPTTLIMRLDTSSDTLSVGNAYVMSQPNTSDAAVSKMSYLALAHTESLTEYLAVQAIDSPVDYVQLYAYGIDAHSKDGKLVVSALYSPLHRDRSASSRSVARVYMALLRHYSGKLDAGIEIEDDPLVLDFTTVLKDASEPPLLIQFLMVLTIAHMTLVPSQENGLIRHMQAHAYNFSPLRYWVHLAICDLILYWLLMLVMAIVSLAVLLLHSPTTLLHFDLLAIPFVLLLYGVGSIPQAYLFSLGPNASLNSMAFTITNIVFGEVTLIATLFYGEVYALAVTFMALSPQFNMAYALVKIRQNFLYNSECLIFDKKNICALRELHRCCSKCGVLQECFQRKSYVSSIQVQINCILSTALLMFVILLFWEYRIIHIIWRSLVRWVESLGTLSPANKQDETKLTHGAARERLHAIQKNYEFLYKQQPRDPALTNFATCLLLVNVSKVGGSLYHVRNIYLGVAKGETLALSGLRRQGRKLLCEMIAGYKLRNEGHFWVIGKYRQRYSPHNYARQVSMCSDLMSLPPWMTVYDALEMIAIMRGMPWKHIPKQLYYYINALDLHKQEDLQICQLQEIELNRLNFVAAVIAAPPLLVFLNPAAHQSLVVQSSMFCIMNLLKKRGHGIVQSAPNMDSHMAVANRLAIMRDGMLYEVDDMDNLQERYGSKGFTVVVHLKDDINIEHLFTEYFGDFTINDMTDELANVQVKDIDLTWAMVFTKMEQLIAENERVYSYIVCTTPIDYIYQRIIAGTTGLKMSEESTTKVWLKKIFGRQKVELEPDKSSVVNLQKYVTRYSISKLISLPWSVIFQR